MKKVLVVTEFLGYDSQGVKVYAFEEKESLTVSTLRSLVDLGIGSQLQCVVSPKSPVNEFKDLVYFEFEVKEVVGYAGKVAVSDFGYFRFKKDLQSFMSGGVL